MKEKIRFLDLKLIDYLYLAVGVFVTMPIVTVNIDGHLISLFQITIIILTGVLFARCCLSPKNKVVGNNTTLLIVWLCITFIASVFGMIYFVNMPEWFNNVTSYIPKIILYLLFLLLYSSAKIDNKKEKLLLKGFIFGCIINIAWSVIDGMIFYTLGYSITNSVFSDYAFKNSIRYGTISLIGEESIRSAGLNNDPAHLGMIIPVVILYSFLRKKYWLIILSIVAIGTSQSTTSLVVSIIVVLLNANSLIQKIKYKIKAKKIFVFTIVIISTVYIFNSSKINFTNIIKEGMNNTFNRINREYVKDNKTENIRVIYHSHFPSAVCFSGPRVITGTGFGTASYPYVFYDKITDVIGNHNLLPYDPESTYISYFFNTGIIGFIIYIWLLFGLYKYYKKNNNVSEENCIIFSGVSAIIFSSFFYHYILFSCQVIILIVATIRKDRQISQKMEKSCQL